MCAGSTARDQSDQPTPTGRPDNGTSPGSPYVRTPFTCPPSSNSIYVTRCMVISSLVGATLSYPGSFSGTVCRPRQVVSCTRRFPSTSIEVVSPRMSGKASSKRRKRSTYPLGTCGCPVARVIHQHDVRGEMTGNLGVVAPIPRCEQRIGPIACALVVHAVPPMELRAHPVQRGDRVRPGGSALRGRSGYPRKPRRVAPGKGGCENDSSRSPITRGSRVGLSL